LIINMIGSDTTPKIMAGSECQGTRSHMEDAHVCARLTDDIVLCGVFDGHGGKHVARHCADTLATEVARAMQRYPGAPHDKVMREVFRCMDANAPAANVAGTTATVAMLLANRDIVVAHCGDSRAILCRRDGTHVSLTKDHVPTDPDELHRITACNGSVFHWRGTDRLMGILAMSRAIGDHDLKRYGLSHDPDVRVHHNVDDEYLILATDGVFGSLAESDVVSLVRRCARRCEERGVPREARPKVCARVVTRVVAERNGQDNATVVVLFL
jgi:protein phosphatase 2C